MPWDEANQKAKELYEEWCLKCDEIEKHAKETGQWKTGGMDSNRELFTDLWIETVQKLSEIKVQVDE